MEKKQSYFNPLKGDPVNFQNLEEGNIIHELEKKEVEINTDKLKGKQTLNELR